MELLVVTLVVPVALPWQQLPVEGDAAPGVLEVLEARQVASLGVS